MIPYESSIKNRIVDKIRVREKFVSWYILRSANLLHLFWSIYLQWVILLEELILLCFCSAMYNLQGMAALTKIIPIKNIEMVMKFKNQPPEQLGYCLIKILYLI